VRGRSSINPFRRDRQCAIAHAGDEVGVELRNGPSPTKRVRL
jgi:hypothetical protein